MPYHGIKVRSVDALAPRACRPPDQQPTSTGSVYTRPCRINLIARVAGVSALPVSGVTARQVVVAIARYRWPTRVNQLGSSTVALVRTDDGVCVSQHRGVDREHMAWHGPVVARRRHVGDPIPQITK